jgi:hypothetical protein
LNQQTSLRNHLIRGASGTLVLKIVNTALALLMAVILVDTSVLIDFF